MTTPTKTPTSNRRDAIEVIRRLQSAGHQAVLAGGCVRDQLLGLEVADFDIATSATPGQVLTLFPHAQKVGAAFGVVLVRQHSSQMEVATFRTDGTYADGRRPDTVTFATMEEDAARRDFTINGMYFDPLAGDGTGRLIDLVGGRADLNAGLVRCIGSADARFAEDHLRLLRAVRFAARLRFHLETGTLSSIRRCAPQLTRIAPERIADELRRMLVADSRPVAWDLLVATGLAAVCFRSSIKPFPLAAALSKINAPADTGVAMALVALASVASFGMTAQQSKSARGNLRHWFKLSNDELDTAERCWLTLGRWFNPTSPPPSVFNRDVVAMGGTAGTGEIVDLALARTRCSQWLAALTAVGAGVEDGDSAGRDGGKETGGVSFPARAIELTARLNSMTDEKLAPRPLLDGVRLMNLGVPAGRRMGELLRTAYELQLDGELTTPVAAEQWVISQIGT